MNKWTVKLCRKTHHWYAVCENKSLCHFNKN